MIRIRTLSVATLAVMASVVVPTAFRASASSSLSPIVYSPARGHAFGEMNAFARTSGRDSALGFGRTAFARHRPPTTTTTTPPPSTTTSPSTTTTVGSTTTIASTTTTVAPTTTTSSSTTTTASTSNGINYHGGPVMVTTTNAYEIWYGNWTTQSTPARQALVDGFLKGIGGTPWYNINASYYNSTGIHVMNSVHVAGSTTVGGSYATSLSDSGVANVVSNAITSGALPNDPNGVYFVFTSKDVTETSGFLTKYCGWHTAETVGSSWVKYSFVGDPSNGLAACAAQSTSPNGDAAGDAMLSVVAHELSETVTDPLLNAWYNSQSGMENGDLCAWNFGTVTKQSNGSYSNVTFTTGSVSTNYLIQQNWVNAAGGYCALSY
jgi:hypothetical protein